MVPFNLTCLHCLQHSFFEHLFNLYYIIYIPGNTSLCYRQNCTGLSVISVFKDARYVSSYPYNWSQFMQYASILNGFTL